MDKIGKTFCASQSTKLCWPSWLVFISPKSTWKTFSLAQPFIPSSKCKTSRWPYDLAGATLWVKCYLSALLHRGPWNRNIIRTLFAINIGITRDHQRVFILWILLMKARYMDSIFGDWCKCIVFLQSANGTTHVYTHPPTLALSYTHT